MFLTANDHMCRRAGTSNRVKLKTSPSDSEYPPMAIGEESGQRTAVAMTARCTGGRIRVHALCKSAASKTALTWSSSECR